VLVPVPLIVEAFDAVLEPVELPVAVPVDAAVPMELGEPEPDPVRVSRGLKEGVADPVLVGVRVPVDVPVPVVDGVIGDVGETVARAVKEGLAVPVALVVKPAV